MSPELGKYLSLIICIDAFFLSRVGMANWMCYHINAFRKTCETIMAGSDELCTSCYNPRPDTYRPNETNPYVSILSTRSLLFNCMRTCCVVHRCISDNQAFAFYPRYHII
jgi:hypothetical protein